VLDLGRRLWLWTALAWLGAAMLATALTLPAVWWEPLHGDEIVTLRFARRSPGEILDNIFVNRGGAPLHFLVERVTLAWPDGLAGLRLPSVVFFVLALPAAGLVAGRLVDRRAALILPFALACAPLAVGLGTFGRMYSMFLAATLWATVLALWAARKDRWWAWTLAGIAAGLLVYVHPVAPLYSALVVATGLICAAVPLRRLLKVGWTAPVALALVQIPYYAVALGVLRDRYEVELGAPRAQAIRSAGRSVPEQSLIGLGPGELAGSFFALALALVGLAWLATDRPRPAIALALWGVLPVAFFTFVPTGTTFFFPRYLLPALPFFLLLVVSGCLAFLVFGRVGAFATGALLAGVFAWQLYDVVVELDDLRDLRMRALVDVTEERQPALLFAAVGDTPFARRPPRYLDEFVELERRGTRKAPEADPERLAEFVESSAEPAVGVWIFAGPPSTIATARERLEAVPGGELVTISPSILVVRSAEPQEPRELVELAAGLREAWLTDVPDDGEAERLLRRDRFALGAS
jgi:hypothetical protein